MSYTASRISTTPSTESLLIALCKVSPVMGIPASKESRLTANLNVTLQSQCISAYFTSHYNNTCSSNGYGRTPLAVAHTVACSEPKSVLHLWHQPINGVAESKSTAHLSRINSTSCSTQSLLVNCAISTFSILLLDAVADLSGALAGFFPVQFNAVMSNFPYHRRIWSTWSCRLNKNAKHSEYNQVLVSDNS